MNAKFGLRLAYYGSVVLAMVTCGYSVALWFYARLYQGTQSQYLDHQLEMRNSAAVLHPIAETAVVPSGGVLGRLEIPRIGVSVVIVEGVEAANLGHAVGHIPGTALPGERGNVALAGHRDTFFRPLAGIRAGDTITLRTLKGTFRYQVVSTEVVRSDNVAPLYPTTRDALTLVTCYPFHYVGAAPMRFIVQAIR